MKWNNNNKNNNNNNNNGNDSSSNKSCDVIQLYWIEMNWINIIYLKGFITRVSGAFNGGAYWISWISMLVQL